MKEKRDTHKQQPDTNAQTHAKPNQNAAAQQ
jgi:hypothetical protein